MNNDIISCCQYWFSIICDPSFSIFKIIVVESAGNGENQQRGNASDNATEQHGDHQRAHHESVLRVKHRRIKRRDAAEKDQKGDRIKQTQIKAAPARRFYVKNVQKEILRN